MAVFWSAVSLKYEQYRTFGRPSSESVNQDLHILWWFHWIVTSSSLSWKYTWTQHLMHWLWMGSEVSNFPSSIKSLEYDIQLPRKVLFRYDHHASVLWFSINFPKIKLPSIFHRRRETKCWTPTITRSIHLECSVKKGVLRNFTKLTGKHLCQGLFFNKVAGLGLTLAQVFSCEFCEISMNTFSYRMPLVAASGGSKPPCTLDEV